MKKAWFFIQFKRSVHDEESGVGFLADSDFSNVKAMTDAKALGIFIPIGMRKLNPERNTNFYSVNVYELLPNGDRKQRPDLEEKLNLLKAR